MASDSGPCTWPSRILWARWRWPFIGRESPRYGGRGKLGVEEEEDYIFEGNWIIEIAEDSQIQF